MDWKRLALATAGAAEEKKAQRVVLLDLSRVTLVADFFLIASAATQVQVKAIADHIEERLGRLGAHPRHREGYVLGAWVLLDYGALVVHVFREEERQFYNLERLWGDATAVEVPAPAAAGPASPDSAAACGRDGDADVSETIRGGSDAGQA